MSYLMAVLMGLIQGVAEFLPISSSGHLALFQAFFGMENVEETHMFFSVLLHLGTLVSICIFYWRDILELIREFFLGIVALFRPDGAPSAARRLVLLIIIGTLPLFVMVFLKDYINALFVNSIPVSMMLLVTGTMLFFSDRLTKGRKTAKSATLADALVVGCAQAVAVIPGISRSGATISAGMMRGFDRGFAVRYSFLLSLPAVIGAGILELKDALEMPDFAQVVMPQLPQYLVGVAVAAVVGYFSIRLVKTLADKGKFGLFAYYCWVMGGGTLIAGIVKVFFLK